MEWRRNCVLCQLQQSCHNLFVIVLYKMWGEGREGGRDSNCLFSSKMWFCQVCVPWSDKTVNYNRHSSNKKHKQIYLNIKHSSGQLEEFLDFDHLFSNIFDLFESKMKMNQSKYWQEKVADSNFTNEKFSLFGTDILEFVSKSRVKLFIFRSGAGNDKSCLVTFLIVGLIRILFIE